MVKKILIAAFFAYGCIGSALSGGAYAGDPLKVIVTIKPVHSLAAAIMDGAGKPELLITGAGSPHSYALKPSDARRLSSANIIIRVSPNLETFLEKPVASLAKNAKVVTLAEIPRLKLLPVRQGGAFEDHDHGSQEKEHPHGHSSNSDQSERHHEAYDAHLWLSPTNAPAITDYLADVFSEARPEQATLFHNNAEKLKKRIAALDADLKRKLTPLKGKPFIVFHDAYQYFEDHYRLHAAGSVTLSPERQAGAARLTEIRTKISQTKSVCVFSEPQFKPKLVNTLIEGTDAKTATMDPLGAALPEGPDQYFQLMFDLAKSLNDCLAGSS
jgi:zinc transport system substrate-binding protein